MDNGKEFSIKPVGSRALGSMRIEKGYGSWSREYSPEWYPTESGLAVLVKTEKPEFLGKEAYMKLKDLPARQLLCNFSIDTEPGDKGADAWGGEAIFKDGKYVGRITSGSYSFEFNTSVALGYVNTPEVEKGGTYEVAILGRHHEARLLAEPLFDPRGQHASAQRTYGVSCRRIYCPPWGVWHYGRSFRSNYLVTTENPCKTNWIAECLRILRSPDNIPGARSRPGIH